MSTPNPTPPAPFDPPPSARAAMLNRLALQNALVLGETDPDVQRRLTLESLALNERMAAVCAEILKRQQEHITHLRTLLGLDQKGPDA